MLTTPTRQCASCAERKTVKGVWYLVAPAVADEPLFFCEGCYQRTVLPPRVSPGEPLMRDVRPELALGPSFNPLD